MFQVSFSAFGRHFASQGEAEAHALRSFETQAVSSTATCSIFEHVAGFGFTTVATVSWLGYGMGLSGAQCLP